MTNEQSMAYQKKFGEMPLGRRRCMDCRCTGKGECPGETVGQQAVWQAMMDTELARKST